MGEDSKKPDLSNVKVMTPEGWFPIGKVEDAEIFDPKAEDGELIGTDFTGFRLGTEMSFTAEIEVENPLMLKLQLMGIPVVNVIFCKNCAKHDTLDCPGWGKGFRDYDTCSKGVLRNE